MRYIFRGNNDFFVSLANPNKVKQDCPIVNIPIRQLWNKEPLMKKLRTFLKLKYVPDEFLIQKTAHEIFIEEFFGDKDDLAIPLIDLMIWHQNQDWELTSIQKEDNTKADALEAMTNLTRKRYWEFSSPELNLRLFKRQPFIASIVFPLVTKIPIRSMQYFVDVHSRYAFDRIRKSGHLYARELISYLYDILITNQKTAITLQSLLKNIDKIRRIKGNSVLLNSEIDAISDIDQIITYSKASIEKISIMTGYTFNIIKLDEQKRHEKRINHLTSKMPEAVKRKPIFNFFIENISISQLEDLNRFRTGILHKKGISKIQPQSHYQNNESYKSIYDFFNFLFEQHCKNSALLVASLGLLTDELVKIDKSDFEYTGIPIKSLIKELEEI